MAVYLKEKGKTVACFTTEQGYSDILCSINDKLDLCMLFQRHGYPEAKPYYTESFGGVWITPYLNNSITFCNKDTSIDEMNDKMKNVFDPAFSEFIKIMGEGHIVNLSEDKMKIIDIVDRVYSPINNGTNMTKPLFIKNLIDSIPDLDRFNAKTEQEKVDYIKICYYMAWVLPLIQTKDKEVEQILKSNESYAQKLKHIFDLFEGITKKG